MKKLLIDLDISKLIFISLQVALEIPTEVKLSQDIVSYCCSSLVFLANQPLRTEIFFKYGVLESLLNNMQKDFSSGSGPSQEVQICCLKAIRAMSDSYPECSSYIVSVDADRLICDSANFLSDVIIDRKLDSKFDGAAVVTMIEHIVTSQDDDDYHGDNKCLLS